jgi:hypothetical protein
MGDAHRRAMKTVASILVLMAAMASASAEPVWNIRTELLVVRVPETEGLRLRPMLRESKTITAGVAELHAMIARNDAALAGIAIGWSRAKPPAAPDPKKQPQPQLAADLSQPPPSSADADWHFNGGVSEANEELRYASTFDPPQFPQNFGGPPPRKKKPFDPSNLLSEMPTSFESRNLSLSLEIDPDVRTDGQTIWLDVVAYHSSFEGFRSTVQSALLKEDWRFLQPNFRTLKTTTALATRSGEWRLLNVSVPRKPAPAMQFFLFRVTALPVRP